MIDPFVLLTPVLLLAVIALLRFAGCIIKPSQNDRPPGSVVDPSNPLATNLVGLFIMNEGMGNIDNNLVDGQPAIFAGPSLPTWNTDDPSIVFNGGGAMNSFLDYFHPATDLAFAQLPTGLMTIVARVNGNTLAPAGICEKNDGVNQDSGFLFGWGSNGALALTVQKTGVNMRVATDPGAVPNGKWAQVACTWDGTVGTADAALFYVNGVLQTIPTPNKVTGSGAIGEAGAQNKPFRIGTAGNATSYPSEPMVGSLEGKMAYLAIYKGKILSPGEMNMLDAELPIKTP